MRLIIEQLRKRLALGLFAALVGFFPLASSAATPGLSGVVPATVTGANVNQTLSLRGSNLQTGLKVTVFATSFQKTLDAGQVRWLSAAEVQISINTTVQADNWSVEVMNPDGQRSGRVGFRVNAPAVAAAPPVAVLPKPAPAAPSPPPAVLAPATPAPTGSPPTLAGVVPNMVTGSKAAQTFALQGSNLQPGLLVTVFATNFQKTLDATQVRWLSASEAQMTIITDTFADIWGVEVANPDGKRSGRVGFRIVAAPAIAAAPAVPLPQPAAQPQVPATPTVGVTQAPALSGLTPSVAIGSKTAQTFSLHGSNFVAGLHVTVFAMNFQKTLDAVQVRWVSAIEVQMTIITDTVADNWSVEVTNPDGKRSGRVGFRVTAPAFVAAPMLPTPQTPLPVASPSPQPAAQPRVAAPTVAVTQAPSLAGVTPSVANGSKTAQTFTLNGSGLASGLRVTVFATNFQKSLDPVQVRWVSANEVQMTIVTDTVADNWSVDVTNPDGNRSGRAVFRINAPAGPVAVSPVAASPQPATLPPNTTPAQPAALPASTGTVGVVSPILNAVIPSTVTGSKAQQTFSLTGANLQKDLRVTVHATKFQKTLDPTQVRWISATQVQMSIVTGIDADNWSVEVANPDGHSSTRVSLRVNAPVGVAPITGAGGNAPVVSPQAPGGTAGPPLALATLAGLKEGERLGAIATLARNGQLIAPLSASDGALLLAGTTQANRASSIGEMARVFKSDLTGQEAAMILGPAADLQEGNRYSAIAVLARAKRFGPSLGGDASLALDGATQQHRGAAIGEIAPYLRTDMRGQPVATILGSAQVLTEGNRFSAIAAIARAGRMPQALTAAEGESILAGATQANRASSISEMARYFASGLSGQDTAIVLGQSGETSEGNRLSAIAALARAGKLRPNLSDAELALVLQGTSGSVRAAALGEISNLAVTNSPGASGPTIAKVGEAPPTGRCATPRTFVDPKKEFPTCVNTPSGPLLRASDGCYRGPAASGANAEKFARQVFGLSSAANSTSSACVTYPYRGDLYNAFGNEVHAGIDLRADGAKVFALEGGVAKLRFNVTQGHSTLIVENPQAGRKVLYLHMKQMNVAEGDKVSRGQLIGISGSVGAPKPHLHVEVWPSGSPHYGSEAAITGNSACGGKCTDGDIAARTTDPLMVLR